MLRTKPATLKFLLSRELYAKQFGHRAIGYNPN